MRKFIRLFGIATLLSICTAPANAQNYPWCAQYTGSMGGSINCGFTSFAQCQADVSGIGGFCIRNNTYRPQGAPRRPHRSKRSQDER
jgi:hypothetical protein